MMPWIAPSATLEAHVVDRLEAAERARHAVKLQERLADGRARARRRVGRDGNLFSRRRGCAPAVAGAAPARQTRSRTLQ